MGFPCERRVAVDLILCFLFGFKDLFKNSVGEWLKENSLKSRATGLRVLSQLTCPRGLFPGVGEDDL